MSGVRYTNESKNNEPIYIEILSFKDTLRANIGGNPFNIIVAYHSKKRGEELVKKYKENSSQKVFLWSEMV